MHPKLSRFSVNANASVISSKLKLRPMITRTGSTEHPLRGQAAYLVNAALTLRARAESRGRHGAVRGERPAAAHARHAAAAPTYYEQPSSTLDASFSLVASHGVRLKLAGKNLLDGKRQLLQGGKGSLGLPQLPQRLAVALVGLVMRARSFALAPIALLLAGSWRSLRHGPGAASAGRPSVKDSPGYVPLVDPESSPCASAGARTRHSSRSASRRRREAWPSSAARCAGVCSIRRPIRCCIWRHGRRVPRHPVARVPAEPPATGVQWEDAWKVLYARQRAGVAHAKRDYGNHWYQLVSVKARTPCRVTGTSRCIRA